MKRIMNPVVLLTGLLLHFLCAGCFPKDKFVLDFYNDSDENVYVVVGTTYVDSEEEWGKTEYCLEELVRPREHTKLFHPWGLLAYDYANEDGTVTIRVMRVKSVEDDLEVVWRDILWMHIFTEDELDACNRTIHFEMPEESPAAPSAPAAPGSPAAL